MAPATKTIAIVGATGNQGSGAAKTFAKLGWHVKGLTRNVNSSSAKELAALGVEPVQADLDDPQTLKAAFKGAHAIFSATDFFSLTKYPNLQELLETKYKGLPLNRACFEHETQHGKNIFSAAAEVLAEDGVLETFVFSTLCHVSRVTKGALKEVIHFDCKALLEEHLRAEYPKLAARTSYLHVGFYYSNFNFPFMQPVKQDDGSFLFQWPIFNRDSRLPCLDPPQDVGIFVKALLGAPHGTVLMGESDPMTPQKIIDLWAEVTGAKAKLVIVPREEIEPKIESMMPSFGAEMVEAFQYVRDYGYDTGNPEEKKPGDLGVKKSELSTYRSWFESQDWSGLLQA